jgi:hypothetical protein
MVCDEIEMIREGTEGSTRTEANFFCKAQAYQCGKPLKKC